MRRRLAATTFVVGLAFAFALPGIAGASGDSLVTRDNTPASYLRSDGGSDATTQACSTGRRSQNEPTVAVDPNNTQVVAAGSNDYCTQIVNGDVWAGYYRSTNSGGAWQDSLVPGYPDDSSAGGVASPAHNVCAAAGDPTMSFDTAGRLFYGFICFNRGKPVNGGIFVARYLNDGASYDRTVLVKKGSPSAHFATSGHFQDKVNLAVDQSGGPRDGYVYVAWSQYNGASGNNEVLVSRSTDHGVTFSQPVKATPKEHGTASYTDLAVGPDGNVYLTYVTYASSSRPTNDFWLVRSTDGGNTWGPALNVASVTLFDSNQFSGNGAYDCGDGPFACPSGLTYSRFASNSAVAADATGVHVVYAAENENGQSKVFARNSANGTSWSGPPAQLDSAATGHQWFPDVASSGGTLTAVFYDSRNDPAYSPALPPGNTAAGSTSGDVVTTYIARSTNGGASWTETPVSSADSNFGWETHGSRRIGFWGDYLYVSAWGSAVSVIWTDSRDLVPGADPRETGADDDTDGFDVFQPCTYDPNDINAASYSSPGVSDPCLSQGGLDQNIYGARV
ncbi:MAG: hypothetical protein ABR600_14030 [Actinomycetota bacterium]